ncbi:LytR/AlgR family response regulator transcription factor [Chryseobacterium sp. PTM-20240506]|uniref:LytR/AlgR family response regulator transcription factor n=1 Tax=unclassified Chryseobacterium TaxID=2593645 RepID=UPI002359FDC8|nr:MULTISPECIES: response regulator transcription factor [unclassified Chryseobacterium]MDC8104310.1 response regulator transcription factor [Chryseobacterium sp. B21-037]MDQ1803920.1 response regulator transcription factor [Chryseobacterium sp. CKR4-1]WBV57844.1 response regulator transcription factor [Chryseobacterium daecheongense]
MKTKIQACIIDDEQDGRDYISLLLKNEFPDIQISFQASSVEEAYVNLLKNAPDILFLDIQLKDGTAFDLLSKFKEISSQIIFITAFEHFAIQAIKNGATDYLLKPIKKMDFIIAVNKALEINKKNRTSTPAVHQNKISLPTMQGFKLTNIADIVRCEADSSYTTFYMSDKTKVIVSKTLHEFEDFLSDYNFFRIHHKHLINLSHLKEYIKGKGGQVIMTDNSVLDVSVRKKNDFLNKIEQLE